MQLTKTPIIIVGILTFLPFIGLMSLMGLLLFEILFLMLSDTPVNPLLYLSYLGYVVPIISVFVLIYLSLGIFYFIHIIQNDLLDAEKKVLWITVLIILNGLSMPFYWYKHLWKRVRQQDAFKPNAW
ncbi:MAG: hypothetical protein R3222_06510 [Balneolaceae bacterium]|nr:hypothetical protein [Balneolaceae bacterium]